MEISEKAKSKMREVEEKELIKKMVENRICPKCGGDLQTTQISASREARLSAIDLWELFTCPNGCRFENEHMPHLMKGFRRMLKPGYSTIEGRDLAEKMDRNLISLFDYTRIG